jgi:outer membrane scaffolding protein for murein synthesis (MipA/OmpV family)
MGLAAMTYASRLARPAVLLASASFFLLSAPAAAQDGDDEPGWIISIGPGAQLVPKYPGADEVGLAPLGVASLRREGSRLQIPGADSGWGFGLLSSESVFNFGPAVRFAAKREEEDVGAPVGGVDLTFEAGGFVSLLPTEHFRLRAEGRYGLNGHDGFLGDLGADLVLGDRETSVFTIGPRARWADDNYHDAYYSVTPAVAAAAGLPVFDADSGFHAYGVIGAGTIMLSRSWGLYGYARYDRLTGDAADSPITRAFGSRDQFSGGLAIFYNFSVDKLF